MGQVAVATTVTVTDLMLTSYKRPPISKYSIEAQSLRNQIYASTEISRTRLAVRSLEE